VTTAENQLTKFCVVYRVKVNQGPTFFL